VVGLEEGIFPGASAVYNEEELEEERRLCYVAMTRAKEKLTMTCCRQRMLYGRTSANRSSRFLDEIPADNMQWLSKPQPRFGGMEGDSTFGGDRWDSPYSDSGYSRSSGGSWSSGGVNSYYGTPKPTPKPSAGAGRTAPASSAMLQLNKGDMVEHTAFGKGMVMNLRPMGGDALVEVAFDTVGTKKLMLKSAGIHMKKL
jgi:DNA helicase-2/ATP-dependent DNA helicase PcrA